MAPRVCASARVAALEGLRETSAREFKRGFCDACFSLEYPVPVNAEESVPQLSLFRSIDDDDPE